MAEPQKTDESLAPINLWKGAFGRLRSTWQRMLAINGVFSLVGILIFAPLLGLTGKLLLRFSGEPAVADQDIAVFLLSPFGLIAFVIFAALLVGIAVFQQSSMMRLVLSDLRGEHLGVFEALYFSVFQSRPIFFFSGHLVLRLLAIVLPFVGLGAIVALQMITDYDINYYLSEKPPEFIRAALLIGLILAFGAVILVRKLIDWSLALPLVLYSGTPPRDSFGESARFLSGHRSTMLFSLLLWALSTLLMGLAVIVIVRLTGGIVVPTVAGNLLVLVLVLTLLMALLLAGNFIVTAVSSAHFATIVTLAFERLAALTGKTSPVSSEPGRRTAWLSPGRLAFGLVAAAVAAVVAGLSLLQGIQTEDNVLVIAHRGAAGRAPENTLASIRAALDDRADWVEIDVQETADGEVVVVHDSDFMKLAGNATKVWEVTLDQLTDIDVGSWFGDNFADQRVPTLREVLEVARDTANVVIELKYYGHDDRLEARVADIVEATNMEGQVAIMSLKYEGVSKMKQLRPSWPVGLLSATAIGDLTRLDTDFLAVSTNSVSRGFVRRAHEAGKQVFVWTVNDPVTMSQVISSGVDGVITDEPAMAKQVLEDRAKLSTPERLLIRAAMFLGQDFSPQYRDDSP